MSRNGPWSILVQRRPSGSLMNPMILISLLFQIFTVAFLQGIVIWDLQTRGKYLKELFRKINFFRSHKKDFLVKLF